MTIKTIPFRDKYRYSMAIRDSSGICTAYSHALSCTVLRQPINLVSELDNWLNRITISWQVRQLHLRILKANSTVCLHFCLKHYTIKQGSTNLLKRGPVYCPSDFRGARLCRVQ